MQEAVDKLPPLAQKSSKKEQNGIRAFLTTTATVPTRTKKIKKGNNDSASAEDVVNDSSSRPANSSSIVDKPVFSLNTLASSEKKSFIEKNPEFQPCQFRNKHNVYTTTHAAPSKSPPHAA